MSMVHICSSETGDNKSCCVLLVYTEMEVNEVSNSHLYKSHYRPYFIQTLIS